MTFRKLYKRFLIDYRKPYVVQENTIFFYNNRTLFFIYLISWMNSNLKSLTTELNAFAYIWAKLLKGLLLSKP